MRRADVVIVGAGVMGSAAAWHLARRGVDVVVLERFERGHVRGSSHGTSRIFRLAYADVRYVDLARRALPQWRELEAESGVDLLTTTGGVDHGRADEVEAVAAALATAGARSERLTPDEAAERWPAMRFDPAGPVVFSPDAGRVHADRAVRAFQDGAAARGAELRYDEPAGVIGDGVVRTAVDEYRAGAVVVTAGAWLAPLVPAVALPPLTVTREQVLHFRPTVDQDWPSFIHHRAVGPPVYGLFAPGEGVKVAEHHAGAVVDPDTRSFDVDPVGQRRVVAHVHHWFPGLDPMPVHPVTCLYTTTPTEDFVLERHGRLVVGSACSGHGFKFAPAVGERLADLAQERV